MSDSRRSASLRSCARIALTIGVAAIATQLAGCGKKAAVDEEKLAALAAKLPAPPDLHRTGAGAFEPFRSRSEEGIEHLYVEQFRVGAFRYSNIDDARAALARQSAGAGPAREQANDA